MQEVILEGGDFAKQNTTCTSCVCDTEKPKHRAGQSVFNLCSA